MFGVVAWDGETRWLDIDTDNMTLVVTQMGDTMTPVPELINDNKQGADINNKRPRSDKRRSTEPRSIVEVIDKNGTRRKSIIV